jgi:hypothetical protein
MQSVRSDYIHESVRPSVRMYNLWTTEHISMAFYTEGYTNRYWMNIILVSYSPIQYLIETETNIFIYYFIYSWLIQRRCQHSACTALKLK